MFWTYFIPKSNMLDIETSDTCKLQHPRSMGWNVWFLNLQCKMRIVFIFLLSADMYSLEVLKLS
jgi:hypothetical protein